MQEVASAPPNLWIDDLLWAPNGSHILFMSHVIEDSSSPNVYVVNPDGSGILKIAEGRGTAASWSPDGSRIAVYRETTFDSNVVLYLVAPDGSDKRILVREGGGELVAERSGWENPLRDVPACSEGFVVPEPRKNPNLVKDCETLLMVKNTLAGEGVALNWGAQTPIDQWAGVGIHENPARVEKLHLWDIAGTIPPGLGNLTGIESLEVRGVSGAIPPELGKLTSLKKLNL